MAEKEIVKHGESLPPSPGIGSLQLALFEGCAEGKLWNPTFIVDYPVEVSPLARASDTKQGLTERFELFVVGRELANGYSELNDPEDQAERFKAQVVQKDAGETKPCTTMPTTSARWNSVCRRPAVAASVSTAW